MTSRRTTVTGPRAAATGLRTTVTALVILVTVAPAAANPVPLDRGPICIAGGPCVRPPPPPPPPPPVELAQEPSPAPSAVAPPAWQTFGFHLGLRQLIVVGQDREAFAVGLTWAVPLAGRLHAFAEYDFLFVGAPSSPMTPVVRGRGHGFTAGTRFPLLTTFVGRAHDPSGVRLRPHLDLELGGTAMLVSDDQLGTHGVGQGLAGVRLGLEMVRLHDAGGLAPGSGDLHFTWRATTGGADFTWTFAVGMDWGG